jgi:hypothetical protein
MPRYEKPEFRLGYAEPCTAAEEKPAARNGCFS